MAKKMLSARHALLAGAASLALGVQTAEASPTYQLLTTIPIPASADNNVGGKFVTYDIADVDPVTNLVYLADRSNASVPTKERAISRAASC